MSFAQVLEELPTLTRPQQRELSLRLFEIQSSDADDIAVCEHSAVMGFALVDTMEAEDATK
jgi:hypothetical protein